MSFPRILPFAALLLVCNAMAGFYATAALAALLESLPVSESRPNPRRDPLPKGRAHHDAWCFEGGTCSDQAPSPVPRDAGGR